MAYTAKAPMSQAALRRARRQRAAERAAALLRGEASVELHVESGSVLQRGAEWTSPPSKTHCLQSSASSASSSATPHTMAPSGSCSASGGGTPGAQEVATVGGLNCETEAEKIGEEKEEQDEDATPARWSEMSDEIFTAEENAGDAAQSGDLASVRPARRRRRRGGDQKSITEYAVVSREVPPMRQPGGAVTIADLGFDVGRRPGAVTVDALAAHATHGPVLAPCSPCRARTGGIAGVMSTLPCDSFAKPPPVREAAARIPQVLPSTVWTPVIMLDSDFKSMYSPSNAKSDVVLGTRSPCSTPLAHAFRAKNDASVREPPSPSLQSWLEASGLSTSKDLAAQLEAAMPETYED